MTAKGDRITEVRTISNVITADEDSPDGIREWMSNNSVMYTVTAFFDDQTVVNTTKTNRDKALELQGILLEAVDNPTLFQIECSGLAKSGAPKWKIIAMWTPDGALLYGPKNAVGATQSSGAVRPTAGMSPAAPTAPNKFERAAANIAEDEAQRQKGIRAGNALNAASRAKFVTPDATIVLAEFYLAWLERKASGGGQANGEAHPPSDTNEGTDPYDPDEDYKPDEFSGMEPT